MVTNQYSFLRWAGSKQRLLNILEPYLQKDFNNYHEPFLGGGNVYLNLISENKKSYLSDLNKDLVNCFSQIKTNVKAVIHELRRYQNTKEEYLEERNHIYNCPIKNAAKFIYINRTCYNGIYRVNSQGLFNVPYGYRENVDLITKNKLIEVSSRLRNATIFHGDFTKSLRYIKKNDLVFLDPPYTTAHQHNGFIEYNQKIFSWTDQERLADFIQLIVEKEAFFLLTNAAHKSIEKLYKSYGKPVTIDRYSLIGGIGAKRNKVNEYIFSNINMK